MQKLRKKVAGMLAGILLLGSCHVYATTQEPHTSSKWAEVTYNMTQDDPRVKISFDQPVYPAANRKGYFIQYQNTNDKKMYKSIRREDGGNSIVLGESGTLIDEGSLKPGQLYKYWVIPYHIEYDSSKEDYVTHEAKVENCTPGYFLTEFDPTVKLIKDEQGNQQIQIMTQYIPGATYEILYAKSKVTDYNKIQEVLQIISADAYQDGQGNVVYTLSNPEIGTEYSFYIRVVGLNKGSIFEGNIKDIANINISSNGAILGTKTIPKVVHVKVGTSVSITSVGKDYIQFSSKFSESFKQKIEYIQIVSINEFNEQNTIGEIGQSQFQYNNDEKAYYMNFTYNRPDKKSNYLVIFHFADGKLGDRVPEDVITYTPPDKLSEPMRPQIPSPANEEIISQINLGGVDFYKEYFLKEDAILQSNSKKISIGDTFHGYKKDNEIGIQLIWSGQRKQGQQIQDPQITYDIWMFKDKIPSQYTQYKPLETGDSRSNIFNNSGAVIGFKENLTQYIEGSSIKKIEPNATYYIAVRSRNKLETNKYSEPTVVAITLDKDGDISSPLVLGKPPLRVQEENVTDQMIPIEWQKEWYELKAIDISLYNGLSDTEKELAKQWNSSAYESNSSPELRWTGDGKDKIGPFDKSFVEKYATNYFSRKITLQEDIKYEVKAISYDEVMEEVSKMNDIKKANYTTTLGALRVEAWIQDYENKSQADSKFSLGWDEVTPTQKEKDKTWWQHNVSQYTDIKGIKKKFEANKRYIIMVRTYREINQGNGIEKLYQAFPSYVLGITNNNFKEELPIPNAPKLEKVGSEFSSVSVKWDYNYDFEYELVYGRTEDPNKAQVWPFEVSKIQGEAGYVKNGDPLTVTITGLLPDEEYYIWVRAIQKNTSPQLESEWSNVVILRTKELEAPDVPYGLGLAGGQSLLEIGKDTNPLGPNHMVIEWMQIDADVENQSPAIAYSYQVELADNDAFTDSIITVTGGKNADNTDPNSGNSDYTAEVLAKNMVQFDSLQANQYYYVRVKTILTYTRPDTQEVIVKESAYTIAIKLKTSTSNDEYDGGENGNIIIYPEAIEETYKNGIWTYEIVDAAKVITQIQAQKKYLYTITLENYNNRYDATVRRIQMPKKVLDTLINQSMALQVVTNKGIYEIPGKALQPYANKYSAKDVVRFDFTQMGYLDILGYARSYPEYYVGGEKLEITIQNTQIQKLQTYMTVKLKQSSVSASSSSLNTYQYQYASGSWQKYPHTLDPTNNNYISYSTAYTGLNALYETMISTSSNGTSYAMSELASGYQIGGLGTTYTRNQNVGASQYVNLLLGIQLGRTPINLSASTAASDYVKAKAAGLYISSSRGALTKEQALAGVIKLYEITQGYQIKPSNQVFNKVSANYKEAASKAYAIGLIESIENPQSTVNYETLCDWILQVVQ